MANEEHLKILEEGVDVWNKWREENPDVRPDFSAADLSITDLSGANLSEAVFIDAHLSKANLRMANLKGATLVETNLLRADLSEANLCDAILMVAYLVGANLVGADLRDANFTEANLSSTFLNEANFSRASLTLTNLTNAFLVNTNFEEAKFIDTIFGNVDLSTAIGLEKCKHYGPSIIDYRTLMKSGNLPLSFLRGCGLPDELIELLPSLRDDPVQFYSCFISYSSKDDEFAKRLHADLQDSGVRCWFAPEDLKIGDKTRRRIDESIRTYDKLLLLLSENSIASDWVEYEAERALEQERKRGGTVLFPVRLDDSIMEAEGTWADHIRDRHIGDFRNWKDHDSFQKDFERLLRDLKAEGK